MSDPENSLVSVSENTKLEAENANLKKLLKSMKGWVYLRIDGDVCKIGRSNQLEPIKRAYKNKNTPNLMEVYNSYECEKLIKEEFNKHFELMEGYETFKGDVDKMVHIFHKIVYEYNKSIVEEYELYGNDNKKEIKKESKKDKNDKEIINKNFNHINIEIEIKNKQNNTYPIIKNVDKQCPYCNKCFSTSNRLNYHLSEKKIKCYEVSSKNKSKKVYKYRFNCEYCLKSYSRKDYLIQHMNKHHKLELSVKKIEHNMEIKLEQKIKELMNID